MSNRPTPALSTITGVNPVIHREESANSIVKGPSDAPARRSGCFPFLFSSKKTTGAGRKVSALTGSCCTPHPEKTRGEDVLVVHTCGGFTLMGVLDGVGAWSEHGVDPSLYPLKLNDFLKDEFTAWAQARPSNGGKGDQPLMNILVRAYNRLEKIELKGSTTVCLAMLFPDGDLHVLNLGDSGLRVMRGGSQVFATQVQQANFNAPLQLGLGDRPQDGKYDVIAAESGDAIVIASDGLWDNVWDKEWQADVRGIFGARSPPAGSAIAQLAADLCSKAQRYGCDPAYDSPYAVQGKAFGEPGGGKLDDTSVIVCRVT